jgi:signal transduction histidine kinase
MTHEKETILIVDDEPVSLKMLRAFLAAGNYEVRMATNGLDALAGAEEKPDLILLDIVMPGMDGFETCRRLKESEATRDIPVIFLSAQQDSKIRVTGLTLGGVDYISKPFDAPELLARVKTHLTLRRQELELTGYAKKLEQMVEERTQQLIHADRLAALGTFSAAVAHEINNPLTHIGGNLDFLKIFCDLAVPIVERHAREDQTGKLGHLLPNVAKYHDNIVKSNRRISQFVNSLRDYARKGGVEKLPCRLLDPIDDALGLLGHRLKHGVSVEVNVPAGLQILCDRMKMSQVFVNLFNNATDSMSDCRGEIHVHAATVDDRILVELKDSGPGIPEALSKTVFDPFFTTKGEAQGTGLGLFIVQGIVEEHRGSIHLAPFDGSGAEFHIELPLYESARTL